MEALTFNASATAAAPSCPILLTGEVRNKKN
jgi:hypothetical protein